MTGIQFVTDEKGRRTAVLIDLKKHRAIWEDFWDGLVSESRRKQKGIPYEEYRAKRLKHNGRRGEIPARNKTRCREGTGRAGQCAVRPDRPQDSRACRKSPPAGIEEAQRVQRPM